MTDRPDALDPDEGPVPPATPTPPPAAPTPPAPAAWVPDAEQKNWAIGAHLSPLVLAFFGGIGVLGPLVVYLVKKDQDDFIAEHSREALNFNLTWTIGAFLGVIVAAVLALVTVGLGLIIILPVAFGLMVAWLVFSIRGASAASRGEYYRYPMTVRMVS